MKWPYSQDAIPAAAYLFEAANGNELGAFEKGEITKQGFAGADPNLLASELIEAVHDEHQNDSTFRGTAYWALGKRFDASLLPFFVAALRVEVLRDKWAAYQIMIALRNLEEPIFSEAREGGHGVLDEELNRADAMHYLESKEHMT